MTRKAFKNYNATIISYNNEGKPVSAELAQVEGERVYRSNGHWSPYNGTEEYHNIWLHAKKIFGEITYKIFMDGGAKFKAAFLGQW